MLLNSLLALVTNGGQGRRHCSLTNHLGSVRLMLPTPGTIPTMKNLYKLTFRLGIIPGVNPRKANGALKKKQVAKIRTARPYQRALACVTSLPCHVSRRELSAMTVWGV
jgi:hypothetical protein